MDVIHLTSAQKHQAAGVCARAFFDYPMMVHYLPDERNRMPVLQWYLGCMLNYTLRYGVVQATSDISGLACWLPPGKTRLTTWGLLRSGFFAMPRQFGQKQYKIAEKCDDYVNQVHKALLPGPHWYLWSLTVDPPCQGKGTGSLLTRAGLERIDHDGLPCYLETHLEKNVGYYQRFGFDLERVDKVPGENLPFWAMVRPGKSKNL